MTDRPGDYVPDQVRVPDARQGRSRRSAATRVFYSLFITLALAAILAVVGGLYLYSVFNGPGPLTAEKTISIAENLAAADIADLLEREGVIANAELFSLAGAASGMRARLKPGEYAFKPTTSMRDVLAAIASGRTVVYKLVIPEGFTTEMALERVRRMDQLVGEITLAPPEGALMPATYDVRRGDARDKLVARMMAAQAKLLDEVWARRVSDIAVRTKEEAVILASIVEKETGLAAERPKVAAVFTNRLKKNMRLQSDPTIIYGIVGGKGRLDRALTRADIAEKTAYNTYRFGGLPPGPIANPGRAALEAVLNPEPTEALYFVADGSGGHAFAATLEEHNANVRRWRDLDKNRGQVAETEEVAAVEPPALEEPAENAAPDALPLPASDLKDSAGGAPAVEPSDEGAKTDAAEPVPAPDGESDALAGDLKPAADAKADAAAEDVKTIMPDPVADLGAPELAPPPPDPPKPGTLVVVENRQVPIPMPKPKTR